MTKTETVHVLLFLSLVFIRGRELLGSLVTEMAMWAFELLKCDVC